MRIRDVAAGLRLPEGPVALDDASVRLVEIARGTLSRVARDGRVHVVNERGEHVRGALL